MTAGDHDVERVFEAFRGGTAGSFPRELARSLSWLEDKDPRSDQLFSLLYGEFTTRDQCFRLGLTGAPGVGKSSLIDGLRTEVRIEGLSQGVMRCSPYHINSALYPLIEHTKRLAGWQSEDSVEERLSKLKALLKNYEQSLDETLPLLATLMSLPLEEASYAVLALPSKQIKQI